MAITKKTAHKYLYFNFADFTFIIQSVLLNFLIPNGYKCRPSLKLLIICFFCGYYDFLGAPTCSYFYNRKINIYTTAYAN